MSEEPVESIRDLILQFWYQQAFAVYMICCDLAEARMHSVRSNTHNVHSSVTPSAALQLKHRLCPHEGI